MKSTLLLPLFAGISLATPLVSSSKRQDSKSVEAKCWDDFAPPEKNDELVRCVLGATKAPTTSDEKHAQCSQKGVDAFNPCYTPPPGTEGGFKGECVRRAKTSYDECVKSNDAGLAASSGSTTVTPAPAPSQSDSAPAQQGQQGSLREKCKDAGPSQGCVNAFFHLQGSVGRLLYNCQEGNLAADRGFSLVSPNQLFPSDKFPEGPGCGTSIKEQNRITFAPTDYKPLCKCVVDNKELATAEADKENPRWREEAAGVKDVREG